MRMPIHPNTGLPTTLRQSKFFGVQRILAVNQCGDTTSQRLGTREPAILIQNAKDTGPSTEDFTSSASRERNESFIQPLCQVIQSSTLFQRSQNGSNDFCTSERRSYSVAALANSLSSNGGCANRKAK